VTNCPLFPFLDGESSLKDQGRIPPCLLIKTLERLIQNVFSKSNSSFTAPRLGHSILWEMRKDGQKEGALIIPFFSYMFYKKEGSGLKFHMFYCSFS
jgi:hypothetical protein